MSISKKLRAYTVSFILLFSILSFTILNVDKVKAEDDLGEIMALYDLYQSNIDFNNILHPHPFRYVGVWECDKTITIDGDMTFELFFTSPILTKIKFINQQDSLNISVYRKDVYDNLEILENANGSLKLTPTDFLDSIQKYVITLQNLNQTIMEGESLIFVIEVIQSEKKISNNLADGIENIKNLLIKMAEFLQNSDDQENVDIGEMIEYFIYNLTNITEKLGFDEEEISALFNVFFSSSFYYGSSSYPSSVKFITSDEKSKILYFKNEYSDFQSDLYLLGILHEKIMNETEPNLNISYSWPPIASFLSVLPEEGDFQNETLEDLFPWFVSWIVYTFGEIESLNENIVVYYLHKEYLIDTIRPEDSTTIREKLSADSLKWTGSSFNRNKIVENITADLYIHYPKLLPIGKLEINATLKQGNNTIAWDVKEVDRTNLIELIKRGPNNPTVFTFSNFTSEEFWYNKDLSLEVSVHNKPLFSLFTPTIINYDSSNYPSSITLAFKETENILIDDVSDKITYAGGSAEYVFNVTSKYKDDKVDITVEELQSVGNWTIDYYPKSVNISENGFATIHLFINSTARDETAYDNDEINLLINATGKTGFSSKPTNVSVSFEAVEYNIEVITPDGLKIKHGSEGTYQFIVRNKNKGFVADTYNIDVTSEHNLSLSYNTYIGTTSKPLDVYNEKDKQPAEAILNVTVFIPWYTDISSDVLTFNITSQHSLDYLNDYYKEANATTKIIKPNILESIYKIFESAAQKIGLTGQYAGWTLIGAIFILILIIIILLVLIKKRKFVNLICLERIKEIKPDEKAEFEITVQNPCNRVLTYEFKTLIDSSAEGFDVSLDTTQTIIESKQSTKVKLLVKPTDYVKKGDWIEVKVVAKAIDKKKTSEISTVTTIMDSEIKLHISGVFHWPRIFKKGDRVETSFKLVNNGNLSARNISVILYVNNEEKNKVEDITIPCGGYADINMPWIAVKGKNEVYIVVK